MRSPDSNDLLSFADRWWWFPGNEINPESEFEWRDRKAYLLKPDGSTVKGIATHNHDCCYRRCARPGSIFIGETGDPDSQWVCDFHSHKWHVDRARFLADGIGCEMKEL